jgi:hypothetical protein
LSQSTNYRYPNVDQQHPSKTNSTPRLTLVVDDCDFFRDVDAGNDAARDVVDDEDSEEAEGQAENED